MRPSSITLVCLLLLLSSAAGTLLKEDAYVFSSDKWPSSTLELPSIGNGHLATVVKQDWVHMNGLYNGHTTQSHRAKIPSTNHASFMCMWHRGEGCEERGYQWQGGQERHEFSLDTRTGVYKETHSKGGAQISMEWFVHRTLLPLVVFKVGVASTAKPSWSQGNSFEEATPEKYTVLLSIKDCFSVEDIDFEELVCPFENARCLIGRTRQAEHPSFSKRQSFYMVYDTIPCNITLSSTAPHNTTYFLTSIHFDQTSAFNAFQLGRLWVKKGTLEWRNRKGWDRVWEGGRIEVEGRRDVARAAVASLYSLYISLPISQPSPPQGSEDFVGLSPSGLSWGDSSAYQGHVFWDQEVWMAPPLLLFRPDTARLLLSTRLRTLNTAYYNAELRGLRGLKYPWESAYTGLEAGPYSPCNSHEIHINGDISLAFRSYFHMIAFNHSSSVDDLVGPRTSNLLIGIGDYWLSRVHHNHALDRYEIHCVMPPDEYESCVWNSAYTNYIAMISLQQAHLIAVSLGLGNSSVYGKVASQMYVPYDSQLDYHPEFDGFKQNTVIKQADVILLNFPLMMPMPHSTKLNDLCIYEPLTDAGGPAMSDSMYSVGWLSVGRLQRAHKSFEKMFQHVCGDFQVWTESKCCKGAPNFITGMGGYLQALLFGYGGIRIHPTHLSFNPSLPLNVTTLTFHDIDYKACVFDVSISDASLMIRWKLSAPREGGLGGERRVVVRYEYKDGGVVELVRGGKTLLERKAGNLYVTQA